MTDALSASTPAADPTPAAQPPRSRKKKSAAPAAADRPQQASSSAPTARKVHPLLEQLARLHPALFGARFLPLKLGIFEDLLERHGELLPRDELKVALGLHARSTRYLDCVASGLPRHDLDGQAIEAVAPEHRFHAILEVLRRRASRPDPARPDPRVRALKRLVAAIEEAGLSQADCLLRMPARDEAGAALIDEAFAELRQCSARREALLRAFEASAQSEAHFAEMYGMAIEEVQQTLERARRERA